MKRKELEEKLDAINQRLSALGDLNSLLQQGGSLPALIADFGQKKIAVDSFAADLPTRDAKLKELIAENEELKVNLAKNNNDTENLIKQTQALQDKTNELIKETEVQLGKAANEKLANSFGRVKDDLIIEKKRWFGWLFGAVIALVLATIAVVFWQIKEFGSLYHPNFILKIALTSPIVYFVIFVNREYSRVRNLIEEYTFKASIARSFEAYKEIIETIFIDQQPSIYSQKLEFILNAITDLYSSPMKNIKLNCIKEKENSPDILAKVGDAIKQGEE